MLYFNYTSIKQCITIVLKRTLLCRGSHPWVYIRITAKPLLQPNKSDSLKKTGPSWYLI